MKTFFFLFIFLAHSLFGLTLKDKFEVAEVGSYIVTEQNQLVSLLHLHTVRDHKLIFEEISIPLHKAKKIDWKRWVEKGSPGNTSWILYEMDLEKGAVTECYSVTRKAWVRTEEMNAFLIPLFSLKLQALSEEERFQKGATATPGKVGHRPWGPPQTIEGKKIKDPEYDVYTTRWPHDESDLSDKPIVLYFDKSHPTFPFPYWMQIRDGALKFKMRALDSGSGLYSPFTDIPRRKPFFTRSAQKVDGKVVLSLHSPTYYTKLDLLAIDMSATPRVTHLIPFEKKVDGEAVSIQIDEEKLRSLLTPGHTHLWVVSSENPDIAVESPYSFVP
ncbi:hypothetical protein [Candidatus Neptunochlamydia vexilliferae]|nr:hypothetical protein [Candidatus Neptunochlamydia vexilliferae]